jgi:hypothetical protein
MLPTVGAKVYIVGRHPHAGFAGVIAKVSDTDECWLVRLNKGGSAYVFSRNALKRIL